MRRYLWLWRTVFRNTLLREIRRWRPRYRRIEQAGEGDPTGFDVGIDDEKAGTKTGALRPMAIG
jgi:hypothetical protein